MHRILLASILAFFVQLTVSAQQLPLYTQYVFNPYLINPAMVASQGRGEVNLLYRQQWVAIPNAPKTLQFDVQLPLTSAMSIGLNVNNDKTVLLSQTSAMLTYGYRVYLASEHQLNFGLSAGLYQNRIRVEDLPPVDSSDPALSSAKNNNMAVDGQFGVAYRFRGLSLGFSMINLFDRRTFSDETFQKIKLSQLQNNIAFASYKFQVIPETWFIQPNVAYRMSQDGVNYAEGSAIISYKDMIQVGGGYRQDFGVTSMVRVGWGPFQAGFAYDFPSPTAQVSTGGTREIQLKFIFGDNKIVKKSPNVVASGNDAGVPTPVVQNTTPSETPKEEVKEEVVEEPKNEELKTEPKVEEKKPEEKKPEVVEEKISEPVVLEKKNEPVVVETTPEVKTTTTSAPQGFYLVAGAFDSKENAEKRQKELTAKGFKSEIKESKPDAPVHYWYVIIPKYKSDDMSVEQLKSIQKETGVDDAWYKKADWED